MCDLVARTGRHQQRYEDGCRLVAGCIPFKYVDCDENCNDAKKILKVLMINSPSGPGLLFPKGGWENDETVEEAAVREAVEEAGVKGDLKEFLEDYKFPSKNQQDEFSPEGWCRAYMFALHVNEELPSWPEQNTREREWLTISEAAERCRHDWMKNALEKFLEYYDDDADNNDDDQIVEEGEQSPDNPDNSSLLQDEGLS